MVIIIGRVTKDLEPQTSPTGKTYVNFDLAENTGFGENAETVFHRCTIWGEELVDRIVKAKVQKGSLLQVIGEQKLDTYTRKDTGEMVVASNIGVWHWSYVPLGSKKPDDKTGTENAGSEGYNDLPTEDCDNGLPE